MKSTLTDLDSHVQILDCTFRDGGYYNNWDFADSLFIDYLSVLSKTKVNFLEVGFRLPNGPGFRGAHAFTTDSYVNSFELPSEKSLGVMINASDLRDYDSPASFVRDLFAPADKSPIAFVRIASHEAEILDSQEIAQRLIEKGYSVAVNLMQISEVQHKDLRRIANDLSDLPLMSFYVADSLGSMKPEAIEDIFSVLLESTNLPLGLHAHDNLGLALQNSMVAVEKGARFVDGTMRGMGRGPGNTRTEELALALHSSDRDFEGAAELGRFSETTWAKLQADLGWGRNLAYFSAGLFRVHPTYVQELLADSRQDESSILYVVRNLSQMGARRFDHEKLKDAGTPETQATSVHNRVPKFLDWIPSPSKDAIILGPGTSLKQYQRALSLFVTQNPDALILSVNDADLGVSSHSSYRVISHRRQVDPNKQFFADSSCKIIMPVKRLADVLPQEISATCSNVDFIDSNLLDGKAGAVNSPVDNVFAYAAGLAHLAGTKRIYVAGFDGIGSGDRRDFDMVQILGDIRRGLGIEILSLTPTSLPMDTVSPFISSRSASES